MQRAPSHLLAALILLFGCESPGWFCHTPEYAEQHDGGRRKCYAKQEFCRGPCEKQPTAYCYEVGHGFSVGDFYAPPDRYCYATPEACVAAQKSDEATSSCQPADE